MKLPELFKAHQPDIQISQYGRASRPSGMPPLDYSKLSIQALLRPQLDTPTEGDGTLLLRYKGKESGVVSVAELAEGTEWQFRQVQGSNSAKSFRVASCLQWQKCLADQWKQYSALPHADVGLLTMPRQELITNVCDSRNLEGVQVSYSIVRQALGMKFSESDQKWISDVMRAKTSTILSADLIQRIEERTQFLS